MRSDWDPDHRKRPDLQKRYPDITVDEWKHLLRLLAVDFFHNIPNKPRDYLNWQQDLIHKIEQRLKDKLSEDDEIVEVPHWKGPGWTRENKP